ncbi:MAG: HAD-IA family hydrolase [Gammaproteobacteria bacterium]|nr:HAD-IA family hydrolase [Gammaproteobacteria bacterium]
MPDALDTRARAGTFGGLLLDLDGTLVDTAPDMVRVLDTLCDECGVARVPYERARNRISNGVYALLELAFGKLPGHRSTALRSRYLSHYENNLANRSQPFDGIGELLDELDALAIPWGVVTNKPGVYTAPLLAALGFAQRAGCMVSGDTTAHSKPHPEPLLAASRALGVEAVDCLYVGDAEIDIEAGRAAGMFTVAAAYGYIEQPESVSGWRADAVIQDPLELRQWFTA